MDRRDCKRFPVKKSFLYMQVPCRKRPILFPVAGRFYVQVHEVWNVGTVKVFR